MPLGYDAITVDTNIIRHAGYRLETGLIGELAQFKEGAPVFVLSEMVLEETRRQMIAKAGEARDGLQAAIGKARAQGLFDETAGAIFDTQMTEAREAQFAVSLRLDAFLAATGAQIISGSGADFARLIKMYFAPEPPFEPAKKEEFPDAIALLSLEAWATGEGKRILGVSADKGWRAFAARSDGIDVVESLEEALQLLQEHSEAARTAIATLLMRIQAGDLPALAEQVVAKFNEQAPYLWLQGEAASSYFFENEFVEFEADEISFDPAGVPPGITVVRIQSNEVAFTVDARLRGRATGRFSMSAWDSIDREQVGLGSITAVSETKLDAALLVTLEGDPAGEVDALRVAALDIVEADAWIDFGEIEPNFGSDAY